MDREEMISFIIAGELKMMDALKKGHKPHTEDEFQSLRDLIKKYREKLNYKKMNEEKEVICPNCGEKENFHFNYDYGKPNLPIEDVLCNECSHFFEI